MVGRLYGVALGGTFFAESMFTKVNDASKVSLVHQLQTWGFRIIDCQQSSPHVLALGAEEILRRDFLDHLTAALTLPDPRSRWEFDIP